MVLSFFHYKIFLSLVMIFVLKCICGISIAPSAFLGLLFALYIFSHPFILCIVSLNLKQASYRQHMARSNLTYFFCHNLMCKVWPIPAYGRTFSSTCFCGQWYHLTLEPLTLCSSNYISLLSVYYYITI